MKLRAVERLAICAVVLVWACCGCAFDRHAKESLQVASQEQSTGTENLRIDSDQRSALDERRIETTGPIEQEDDAFAPDGGIVSRRITRWAGSTGEDWLKRSSGADEHIILDAGVTDSNSKKVNDVTASGMGTHVGPGVLGWLCIAAGVVLAGALVWRFRGLLL